MPIICSTTCDGLVKLKTKLFRRESFARRSSSSVTGSVRIRSISSNSMSSARAAVFSFVWHDA